MMLETDRKIEIVKGTRDVLPDEYERRRRTSEKIVAAFERFGYRGVEVPTLERVDLHLRKSGEAIRQHMYTFRDQGQVHVCLRPELTASVARMYSSSMLKEQLPLKIYYLGSSFRYDRPQTGRYREFTQAGVELIGAKGPEFDAEAITLACHVMDALGISEYEVVIGNIGIILNLLSQKNIEERVKNKIVESMEDLSREDTVEAAMEKIKDGLAKVGVVLEEPKEEKQIELLKAVSELPEEETTRVVSWVLQTIYGSTETRRSSDEIARNLLARVRTDKQVKQITETIEFISKLTQIKGRPPKVFEEVDALIQDYNLDARPIDELRMIAKYLERYGVDWEKVRIDFGFGRGLQYYTGMIFEIYGKNEILGVSQKQVCGGGRYDTLIGELGGGDDIKALGFSFGLERLVLSLPTEELGESRLDAFVAPVGGNEQFEYALEVASALRASGIRTDIGLRGMAPRSLTGMAKRLRARHAIFVGEDEMSRQCVTLRDMQTGTQVSCSIAQAVAEIQAGGKQ